MGEEKKIVDDSSSLPLFDRPHPWLTIVHGQNKKFQTFYNLSEDRLYTRSFPELRNKYICDVGGGNGWLFLDEPGKSCCFFNIATMEKKQLPPLMNNISIVFGTCLISSVPTDESDCHVLLYNYNRQIVASCKVGDESFIMRNIECNNDGSILRVIMVDGKVYGLSSTQNALMVCDSIEESYKFREVGIEHNWEVVGRGSPCLVESCGQVLLVRKERFGYSMKETTRFKVFRADFTKMAWVRTKNIGKRVIFHENKRGLSCSTIGLKGVKENCIYFMDSIRDRNMHVFDLQDGSFTMYLPCTNVTSNEVALSWIILPHDSKTV